MPTRFQLIGFLSVVLTGIASPGHGSEDPVASAQSSPPRLFTELAGHVYERRAWNRKDELTDLQAIRIGSVEATESGELVLPAELISYRLPESGEPPETRGSFFDESAETGRVSMRWVVEQGVDPSVRLDLMGSIETEKRSLKVELKEMSGVIYPGSIEEGPLPDVRFAIKMRKGMLSFLGARTVIRLRERRAQVLEGDSGRQIEIRSRVSAVFKVIGIPWHRPRFENRQLLDPDGLVEVVLEPRKGGRQEIRRVPDSAGSSARMSR